MSNPKLTAEHVVPVNPDTDALHIKDSRGNIVGWIDNGGAPQGNLALGGVPINFADGEDHSGEIDGLTSTFILVSAPNPSSSLKVYYNSGRQSSAFYSLIGRTVMLTFIPQIGDTIVFDYRY